MLIWPHIALKFINAATQLGTGRKGKKYLQMLTVVPSN